MSSTLHSFLWKFAERCSVQIVSLVINIILARILTPDDYGIVAMAVIFINLSYVIVDGGFNSALIQKKNADVLDFSSVFYFTLLFSIILYLAVFFCAPFISDFYNNKYPQLTSVIRILGIQIIIFGVNSIQIAYVSRKMMFKNLFWSSLIGTIISAIVGILMACTGCGVWAIVTQQLVCISINTLILYSITKRHPKLAFSYTRIKQLLNYGIKLFGANLLITLFQELRAIIIGKIYSAKQLALFDRGRQFPSIIINNINTSIGAVLFPVLSKHQEDLTEIKSLTRKSIRFSAFALSPLMLFMASCAEPLIRLVLTDKWLGCVPLLQWFCIIYLFQPIHTANLQALKAIGRSDICLKLEFIKKSIEICTLLLIMRISVTAIVVNMAVLTILFTFINAYPNKKILNYNYSNQFSDIFPYILFAFISCIPGKLILSFLSVGDILSILIQFSVGSISYFILLSMIKNVELSYLKNLICGHWIFNHKIMRG